MKKLLLIAMILISNFMLTHAQDIYLDIENYPNDTTLCLEFNQTVYVNAQIGCEDFFWSLNGQIIENVTPLIINPVAGRRTIQYYSGPDCGDFYHSFKIKYVDAPVVNSFHKKVWGLPGAITTLHAMGIDSIGDYEIQWQGGPNDNDYDVILPGEYPVTISSPCGTTTRTFIRYDKVEIYRATIDLETNLNKVTWPIISGQDEYISEVKAYRDGFLVGTVPYEQGYFLDNIGSDNAARNYHLVAVTIDGEESPVSFQKGTIHTTYYQDVNNNLNMTWNIPYIEEGANGTLTYFQICKYDPSTGEITVVDQVNAAITDYTCGVNQFDGGYAVIAAVFNDGKGVEELSFSNLTTDILGIEEDCPSTGSRAFTVYPNPAKDRVTIEGTGKATITNALGQTILTKEIDGKATIELPRGMYFVKMNGVTRKIVVE